MSKRKLAVVIVTRFSTYWKEILPSREWIDYRFEILKRTALPSLRQQTIQNFVWILKTAPEHYSYVINLFRSGMLPNSAIRIVSETTSSGVTPEELHDIYPGAEKFIMFRLDSDDAFSSKTIERVFESYDNEEEEDVLFNFPSGVQLEWDTGEMYYLTFRPHRQGPYLALGNTSRDRMLSFVGNPGGHPTARRNVKKVVHVAGLNWLQVVHGTNISNTIRHKKFRYKAPVAKLLSAAATLWPRLKIADASHVPAHAQESILLEFGIYR